MKKIILAGVVTACLATSAMADTVVWNGSTSTNPADGPNWSNGAGVGGADTAEIGNSPQSPDFAGQTFFWGKVNLFFANHIKDTGGGGLLNLSGVEDSQFFSAGDMHVSTIDVDINASKNIQTNGTHSAIFNGDVTARKIEAFGGSVATFNGTVRQTDEFMSIGGGSKIVINGDFYWMNNNHGINNSPVVELGPNARFFRPDNGTPDPDDALPGLDVWNIYNNATVRLLADHALGSGETDIWSRNDVNNTFDMNGYSQNVEFFGLGDAPASLNIDFGSTSGPNKLVWDAAHGMNGPGTYKVVNFEPGIDTLEFGQYGPDAYGMNWQDPARLSRVTINGASYSATNPGVGPYWTTIPTPDLNDDPARTIAVYVVPEPASLALVALGGLGLAFVRKR